ncbi:MAG TPA: Uma2 family endonuclease [Pyrinomonadaceae bacterium]|nr:Uma2 family endonuclease [Pyrinomonadaceae bacterium]
MNLNSRRGLDEYWIIDWRSRDVAVYRRQEAGLQLIGTLKGSDTLQTLLLPGFSSLVNTLFDTVSP